MVNPHFSRWSHCFQSPVGWIAPCGVGCTGRGHVQCLQCRSACQRGLRGDHWGLSQFKGPALMWEQNLKQSKTWEFFCYWHPSFNVPFHLWDVKAMVGVFELIHSIPKRFWASNKVGFFGSSYGYACSLVLWLILSLETTPPLTKQVQH